MKNVVLIMQDHQLFYNHPAIKRPNYDKFVSKSVNFTNARTVTPLCCPARRSILDGMYAHQHGLYNNSVKSPFTETTYLDLLRDNGYDCYYFGKWHAGEKESSYFGCKGFTPEGYSSPYKYDNYSRYLKENNLTENPVAHVDVGLSDIDKFYSGADVPLKEIENLFTLSFGTLMAEDDTHECFYLANTACKQLEQLKDSNRPFALRVDFWGPHQPYFPTKRFLDMYDERDIEVYPSLYDDLKGKPDVYRKENALGLNNNGNIILPTQFDERKWKKMLKYAYAQNTLADYAAGRIVDKIFSLGMDKDTVIIWSADHGDALCSHGGHVDKDSYLSAEVLNIPLAVYNPDGQHGVEDSRYVSNLDIPATILDCAGLAFEGRPSVSLLSSFARDYFVSVTHGHFSRHVALSVEKDGFKYVKNFGDISELYDTEKDKYEMSNLALSEKYSDVVEKFENILEEWMKLNDFKPYK